MTIRTTRQSVTFLRPFTLPATDGVQPAGSYIVETDEELIEGLSFSAYHRTSTRIHLPANSARPGITETVTVDPAELEAALKEDCNE